MTLRSLAALTLLAAACGDSPAPRSATVNPVRDSIRVRSMRRFEERPDTLLARVDTARVLGTPTARLWVVFVGELQCAACARSLHELVPVLRRAYVETGKIRLAYVNAGAADTVYNARFAAHAAFCAGIGGRFWEALDLIAASRDEWASLDDPQPRLDSLAVRAGADPATQSSCRQRQRMLPMVMWDKERAEASKITALPTLLIGDQSFSGDLSPATVRGAIDRALASRR
jgi:protein-disulfide isomerase